MPDEPVNQAELVATMSSEEYARWFEEQVAEAEREASLPGAVTYSNEEVMAMIDDMRTRWLQEDAELIRRNVA
jgi:hypothetical protein